MKISECPIWTLTNRGLWIPFHHCAKRKKTSIICVANLHSLPWNITSKAHKIRITLKRRWIFKRASRNRCLHDAGELRPRRKAAAAAAATAAILCQYIRGQSPTTEMKRILREDRIWTIIPGWQTWRRYYLKRSSSSKSTSTPWWKWKEKKWENIKIPHFQYWEWEVYKIPKIIGKRIHVWGLISPIAFTADASNLWNWRYSRNPKTISGLFHKEWWLTQRFLTKVEFVYTVHRARDHYCIEEAARKVYTLVQKEDKHFLYHGGCTIYPLPWGCTICLDANASEAEVITDPKESRKANCQIHWRPEQDAKYWIHLSATQERILADRVWAIITYQSTLEECVVKVVKEDGNENYSQHNLRLERTRSNTPRHMGVQEVRRFEHASGNREDIAWRGTLTQIPSESRNWPDENLQGQAVHAKNWRFVFPETSFHCQRIYEQDQQKEADQNPQITCCDDLQEAQLVHIDLTQVERVHKKASSKIKRLGRSVSQWRMLRETEKAPFTMIDEKPTDGTSTSKKDQDGHGTMKSENFQGILYIHSPNPDDELKMFFVKVVME